jgi:hypothetical protein
LTPSLEELERMERGKRQEQEPQDRIVGGRDWVEFEDMDL